MATLYLCIMTLNMNFKLQISKKFNLKYYKYVLPLKNDQERSRTAKNDQERSRTAKNGQERLRTVKNG